MTALNGLLDGATADALRGLYGVDGSEEAQASSEDGNSWSDYDDVSDAEVYCDRCGDELTEDEIPKEENPKETLCSECDRRANSHAVGRFLSAKDMKLD